MNKKIFRASFLTAFLTLTVSIFFVFGILYQYFEGQLIGELKSKAGYISYAIESGALEKINGADERITVIAPDGTVVADNEANVAEMENHLERSEVKQALENGSGTSVRYSETLTEKIIYYAVKMSDGNILRVSVKHYTVITLLLGLVQPILVVLLIAAILCFVLSSRVSKSIVKPINSLDLDEPENNEVYEELAPLLKKISRQKKMIAEQLQDAKRKREEFRLITENMSEGFLVIDAERNILTHNSAALKILGNSGESVSDIFELNREKPFRETVGNALSGEKAAGEITLRERVFSVIANPVFENNKIIGAVIVILEVTERARREQLRREFTANVSHELKTPLTSISGFAEMMMNGVPEDVAADFSRSIYDEAQRLIALVGDIIKLSELEENSALLERETVNLRELAENAAKRLKLAADNKNITITIIGGAQINGVRKILDEMIFNLCDNAIKYNKENGEVEIILEKNTLTVRDTGIGIPESAQTRVFERFYRVDKGRSKSAGRTGLGLAIVKHGAICHNAEIRLKSGENEGTEVSVVFPEQ